MPRKLPWVVKDGHKPVKQKADTSHASERRAKASAASSTKPRQHDSDGSDSNRDDGSLSPAPHKKGAVRDRAKLMIEPPEEEFMIDGYDADDGWRMVEDEFFMTARLFTAHLHAAEYNRLKKQAQQDGGNSFYKQREDIVASTAIKATPSTSSADAKGKQRAVETEEVGDDDDPFMQDETLAAMMGTGRNTSQFEELVTRRPASVRPVPQATSTVAIEGWTGRNAQNDGHEKLDMDLDDVPMSIARQSLPLGREGPATGKAGAAPLEAQSVMWIGAGQDAGKMSSASSSMQAPAKTSLKAEKPAIQAVAKAQNGTNRSSCPSTLNAEPATIPDTLRLADANDELPGLKRTALNPKVLARLARRRQQASEAETKKGEPR